jgi:hypothetical protein
MFSEQLNSAKGRLRTILHQALFKRVNEIIDRATCDCKEQTIFDFLKELRRIDVSPLDVSSTKASVAQMLDRLRQYDETKTRSFALSSNDTSVNQSRHSPCSVCWLDGKTIVRQAIARVSSYFDGLCLNCMDRTKDLRVERSKDQAIGFITNGRNSTTGTAAYRTASPPGISASWDARRSAALSPSRRQQPYSRHLDPWSRHITESGLQGKFKSSPS